MNRKAKEGYDFQVKLLMLGDSAVGKSSLITRFCDDTTSSNHIPTIGVDFKYKTIDCEGTKIKLQIWDTAGQEKFRSIVQTYYKGAMGIVLTYAINDRKSFQNIENWMKQISTNAAKGIVVILVGNKADLLERVVETSEGKRVAETHNIKFFEASAKDGENVELIFHELAKEIKNRILSDPEMNEEESYQKQGVIRIGDKLPETEKGGAQASGGCRC